MKLLETSTSKDNYIIKYWRGIESGKIIAGSWVRIVYGLLVKNLESGAYLFDGKKADSAINFIEMFCHHCKGRSDLITLELWEKAFISAIFGIVDADGLRQFREVLLVIGRKNGKSLIASAVACCMLFLDKEFGAEMYCMAPKLEQSALVFSNVYFMCRVEPLLAAEAHKRRKDLYFERTNSTFGQLAFNVKESEGFNPQLVICDEISSWPGLNGIKQYNSMRTGTGARTQPMLLSISTAGYEDEGVYDELVNRGTAFLKGHTSETRLLPVMYMIDDAKKWDDLSELAKANPNLGVSIGVDFYKEQIEIAKSSRVQKAEFLTKYCNIKQNSAQAWLEFDVIKQSFADNLKIEDFKGCYAVGGIDLSKTTDLTAVSAVIEKDGMLHVFTRFYMPRGRLEAMTKEDNIPYSAYVQDGILVLSGDNHVDYRDLESYIDHLRRDLDIYFLEIGYDKYSAQYLVDSMTSKGYKMSDVRQGENLTPVLKEFEGLIKDGKFVFAPNNLLKLHMLNTAVKKNTDSERIKPAKIEHRKRIDGFVSVIDAMTVRQASWPILGSFLVNA